MLHGYLQRTACSCERIAFADMSLERIPRDGRKPLITNNYFRTLYFTYQHWVQISYGSFRFHATTRGGNHFKVFIIQMDVVLNFPAAIIMFLVLICKNLMFLCC